MRGAQRYRYVLLPALAVLSLAAVGRAQFNQGPDVIVGAIVGSNSYGAGNEPGIGTVRAFSVGTTSCNIGDQNLLWQASNPFHPVIAQHAYRVKDGRLEQIGLAWLKHGFAALQGSVCTPCQGTGSGSALGVGCSDPYGPGLNGGQSGAGARSEVNAATGVFPFPRVHTPPYQATIGRRLQIRQSDIDATLNPGALYCIECQYVTQDDASAGNNDNNASYRACTFSGFNLNLTGSTEREKSALYFWQSVDPSVLIENVDVPGDGRIEIGYSATDLPNGNKRIVLAVHNLNSHRAVKGLALGFPNGTTISNPYFHDVFYHSNEIWDGTDWAPTIASNGIQWDANVAVTDPNAIHWGTTYTFECEASNLPNDITLDLWRPGTPSQITIPTPQPPVPGWQTNQIGAHLDIDGATNNGFDGPIHVNKLVGQSGSLNYSSNLVGNAFDIFVNLAPAVENWLVLPNTGQRVNIDLAQPSTQPIFNDFQAVVPAGSQAIPFSTVAPVFVTAQMAVIAPPNPDGIVLSAANELEVTVCNQSTINHALGDDNSVMISFGVGGTHDCISQVPFYGTSYNHLFINSNGSVSFTQGTGDFTASPTQFRNEMPRLAGMWTDLSPNVTGTVSSTSTAAGVLTVSFSNVPQFGASGVQSSFDIVFDTAAGSCSIQNYAPSGGHSDDTLVGISPGNGAGNNPVVWGNLAGSGPQTGPAGAAVYQFVLNGAPAGFTSITFPSSDSTSYVVN